MSSSRFASSFAPYTPPPDDPTYESASVKSHPRHWFPAHDSAQIVNTSYQSGGIPTFGTSDAGGLGALEEIEGGQNQWETTYGTRVDVLAVLAYLLGPISALALLIIETKNDYVRFHAYQSALLSTPLLLLRILASLSRFPSWLQTFFTFTLVGPLLYMAFQAYRDASQRGLSHYQLPVIGQIADNWVQEE